MALVVPNGGENIALSLLVGKASAIRNLVYRLFATNVTPAETDTAGSYTEAAGGGYSAKTLTGSSWTITNGAPTEAAYAEQTWTFTGPLTTNGTVYGYFATRETDNDLVLAEAFTSFTPTNNGDNIKLTPKITAD